MSIAQMIKWMFPKNTLRHHEANVTDGIQIGAQTCKTADKPTSVGNIANYRTEKLLEGLLTLAK
jgi:hypothetical protein